MNRKPLSDARVREIAGGYSLTHDVESVPLAEEVIAARRNATAVILSDGALKRLKQRIEPDRADRGARTWLISHKYDRDGAKLADGHYSRRTPGSPQFMPPGETLVLVTPERDAVFGWWRPHPSSGIEAMNGLDGWTCSIFRRIGGALASGLVLAAEVELAEADARGETAAPCGPDGMLTYVQPSKVRSTNPGYCFLVVGWLKRGYGKKTGRQRKLLLGKPLWLAGVAACEWIPRQPTAGWIEARAAAVSRLRTARAA